jgi:integrating conjugative element protein (TIGR03757 family)
LWLTVPVCAQALNPWAGLVSVEVFCNSAMPIEPVANPPFKQTIYRLDAMQQVLGQINQRIPRGGEQAARPWIAAHQQEIKRLVTPSALATANAINRVNYYRIDRLPAIVVNRASVIYGVTDVADALARYQAHVQGKR